MAKLSAAAATIELRPLRREHPISNWLNTQVGIEYHIGEQRLHVVLPARQVLVQAEEFQELLTKSRAYIAALPILPKPTEHPLPEVLFSPMESTFWLELSCGMFFDEDRHAGSIVVRFYMSLRVLGSETLASDEIGCSVEMSIAQMVAFLDALERELGRILDERE